MNSVRFDTRSVPPARRSTFLRKVVQDVFRIDSDSTALGHDSLETVVERHELDALAMAAVRGGPQEVRLHRDPRHGRAHVVFPMTPDGVIEVEGVRRALLPGCAYVVDAAGSTLIRAPRRFEHLSLSVPRAALKGFGSSLERRGSGPLVLSGAVATMLVGVLRTLFANAPGIAAEAAPSVARSMVELLNAALVESLGGPATPAQRLDSQHRQRIRQYVLTRLTDPELSVDSIAAAVALSTRRIHQLFAASEMTLMRWVWSERPARCYNQLVASAATATRVGDVAFEWGFSDPAHFSRAFRQRYGLSPSQLLRHRTEPAPGVPA